MPERENNQAELPPRIHFFHAEHSPEKLDEIWDQAKNSDVILFEFVADKGFKENLEQLTNKVSGSNSIFEEVAIYGIGHTLDKDGLIFPFVSRVIKSGKELHFLDVNDNERVKDDTDYAFDLLRNASIMFRFRDYTNSYGLYVQHINCLAESSLNRENIVKDQIKNLLFVNREKWAGKSILIVEGAAHTGVYHDIKRNLQKVKVTRSFPLNTYVFPQGTILQRKITFGKETSPIEYKRAYLADFPIVHALIVRSDRTAKRYDISLESVKIANKISDEEVEKYWGKLMNGTFSYKELVTRYFRQGNGDASLVSPNSK